MTPEQYENLVAQYFKRQGYVTHTTPNSNDYGVDVFAERGAEKLAIQVKMYGHTTRSINRQMVMELHGAKDFFDCTRAIIATNGSILPTAAEVARKLGIEILSIKSETTVVPGVRKETQGEVCTLPCDPSLPSFDHIWQNYIMPLEGKTLYRDNGETNKIVKVDWSGIERITSNGNPGKIQIEIFRKAINHVLAHGEIARDTINQEYARRASSGVVLILAQVPIFEFLDKPSRIRLRRNR